MREINIGELCDKNIHAPRSKLPLWGKLLILVVVLIILVFVCIAGRYSGYADNAWGFWYNKVF